MQERSIGISREHPHALAYRVSSPVCGPVRLAPANDNDEAMGRLMAAQYKLPLLWEPKDSLRYLKGMSKRHKEILRTVVEGRFPEGFTRDSIKVTVCKLCTELRIPRDKRGSFSRRDALVRLFALYDGKPVPMPAPASKWMPLLPKGVPEEDKTPVSWRPEDSLPLLVRMSQRYIDVLRDTVEGRVPTGLSQQSARVSVIRLCTELKMPKNRKGRFSRHDGLVQLFALYDGKPVPVIKPVPAIPERGKAKRRDRSVIEAKAVMDRYRNAAQFLLNQEQEITARALAPLVGYPPEKVELFLDFNPHFADGL